MEALRKSIDEKVNDYIQTIQDQRIRDGSAYILQGGKRLRGMITLDILNSLKGKLSQVVLIPELIHTASLIIDDLPAFDNAVTRRGRRCLHLEYNEGIAYLLSFHLFTSSLEIVNKSSAELDNAVLRQLLQNILYNLSSERAIGGQLLSTFHTSGTVNLNACTTSSQLSKAELEEILIKKTSCFFEIALVTGWVFGGGDPAEMDLLKQASKSLGLCYQIYDDFQDVNEDGEISHNFVNSLGKEVARNTFTENWNVFWEILCKLHLTSPFFEELGEWMKLGVY